MDEAELTHIAPTHGNAETVLEDVLLLSFLMVLSDIKVNRVYFLILSQSKDY
jgi:hypothetical protein